MNVNFRMVPGTVDGLDFIGFCSVSLDLVRSSFLISFDIDEFNAAALIHPEIVKSCYAFESRAVFGKAFSLQAAPLF